MQVSGDQYKARNRTHLVPCRLGGTGAAKSFVPPPIRGNDESLLLCE